MHGVGFDIGFRNPEPVESKLLRAVFEIWASLRKTSTSCGFLSGTGSQTEEKSPDP